MEITIRKAGPDDLDLLMEWRMRVLREVFDLNLDEDIMSLYDSNARYYRKHLRDGSHTACFACLSGTDEIIGCGGICYQDEMPSPDNHSGKNGYLMNIYCLPDYRKHGIGEQVVEFLIDDARTRGTEKIYLESSEMAKNMYRKMGFEDMKDYMKLDH